MITFSDAVIADRLTAFTRALDAGGSGGKIMIYGNNRPAGGAAAGADPLAVVVLPYPSLHNVTGKTLTIKTPDPAMAEADGAAKWARLTDSAGSWVADVDAGPAGSATVLQIQNAGGTIYAGGSVTIVIAELTEF